jgi:hypothetical protein
MRISRIRLDRSRPLALAPRADASEWLAAPAWLLDLAVLFQREYLRAGLDLYARQAAMRNPTRLEIVSARGFGRNVLIADGHHPSPWRSTRPLGTTARPHPSVQSGRRVLANQMRAAASATLAVPVARAAAVDGWGMSMLASAAAEWKRTEQSRRARAGWPWRLSMVAISTTSVHPH